MCLKYKNRRKAPLKLNPRHWCNVSVTIFLGSECGSRWPILYLIYTHCTQFIADFARGSDEKEIFKCDATYEITTVTHVVISNRVVYRKHAWSPIIGCRLTLYNDPGQVVCTNMPLSPSSTICYKLESRWQVLRCTGLVYRTLGFVPCCFRGQVKKMTAFSMFYMGYGSLSDCY